MNQKTNPPMIRSTKNYTKKKKKRADRTLGQRVKATLYRQNRTQKHIHTHSQKEKRKNIYISLLPIRCLFRYSTDAGYMKLTVEI